MQDINKPLCIDMRANDACVVFVPLLKTSQLVKAAMPPSPKKESVVAKPVQKVPEKKVLPTKKATTQTVLSQKKDVPKKNVQKKVVKPTPVKKPAQQKVVPKKAVVPKDIKKEIKPAPPKPPETQQAEQSKPQENVTQDTLLVGNEQRDFFILQEQLKKNILEQWKRPTNIPETALCQVKVVVHNDGSKEIIIEKSSQAIALDMSARNFLMHYDFPEQWYGKELSIIF